jgi:hypothetical protein
MTLMLLRSAGIVSILLSLILSFMGTQEAAKLDRLLWLLGGVAVLWLLSLSKYVDRMMRRILERWLRHWTDLDVRDYVGLLKLADDYVIRELQINEGDWLANKKLTECRLREEGVSIIGIYRSNGNYVGVPKGRSVIYPGDTLVLYGLADALQNLDRRHAGYTGDREHSRAVGRQQQRMNEQDREEADYEKEKDTEEDAAK